MLQSTKVSYLSDIADIRTGYTFREKVEEVPKRIGNAHIAQIKDVREISERSFSSTLCPSQLPMIDWQGKEKSLVPSGAVLLPARGSRGGYFQASCIAYEGSDALPLVVTSQFLVISPKTDVLPEFLCWSLNQPKIQFWLSEGAGSQGTGMVMLKASIGRDIQLEVPSIETQQKILHLNQLWEKEQALTQSLLDNRKVMIQGMFQELLKENHLR